MPQQFYVIRKSNGDISHVDDKWDKHKYYARVKVSNGKNKKSKWRYFYTKAEYNAYLKGEKKQDESKKSKDDKKFEDKKSSTSKLKKKIKDVISDGKKSVEKNLKKLSKETKKDVKKQTEKYTDLVKKVVDKVVDKKPIVTKSKIKITSEKELVKKTKKTDKNYDIQHVAPDLDLEKNAGTIEGYERMDTRACVAYEMRRRGYDVVAKSTFDDPKTKPDEDDLTKMFENAKIYTKNDFANNMPDGMPKLDDMVEHDRNKYLSKCIEGVMGDKSEDSRGILSISMEDGHRLDFMVERGKGGAIRANYVGSFPIYYDDDFKIDRSSMAGVPDSDADTSMSLSSLMKYAKDFKFVRTDNLEISKEGLDVIVNRKDAKTREEKLKTIMSGWKKTDKKYSSDEHMNMINPNYEEGYEYTINCSMCSATYELRQRGYDVQANPNDGYDFTNHPEVESWFVDGKHTTNKTIFKETIADWKKSLSADELAVIKDLEKYIDDNDDLSDFYSECSDVAKTIINEHIVKNSGNNSRGMFELYWANGGGHSIVYEVVNNKVVYRDTQLNEIINIEDYLEDASEILYMRTDNLELNYEIAKVARNRK